MIRKETAEVSRYFERKREENELKEAESLVMAVSTLCCICGKHYDFIKDHDAYSCQVYATFDSFSFVKWRLIFCHSC